ncbi:hypothetical protein M422DRAFT_211848 [Sphaerobolus stellatus SS14]|uniref:Unplaced genomic scaffold SPHSTscaffold_98, whole genome shotgun sequence n=1 Tax=Sphaerobolus stellatus (strain SS14) TaxID=990650 RepID=A0A0C9VHB0_SPHS4|nr:hypothetical protein M422DRAFT_211848 [Sphaerobolus stellatus SS14]
MSDPKLTQFKALSFDVYGTLIDWETPVHDAIAPIVRRAGKNWSRKDILTIYTDVETDIQAQNPTALYPTVLADTYYAIAKRLDLPETPELKEASVLFGNSIPDWKPFPDTIDALRRLSKHYKLVVLSNVDRNSFSFTQKILEQGFQFDLILTAQDIGSYKPDLANFEYMLNAVKEKYGIEKHEVIVTANSRKHDHKPANSLGIASSWIKREGSVMGQSGNATYIWDFETLGEMADAADNEGK